MPNQLGKRKICQGCGGQVLVTKTGDGDVECCGVAMTLVEAKALPSSD